MKQKMRQNTPNRILNFKNFPGVTPPDPRNWGLRPRPPIGSRCCGSHNFQIVPARLIIATVHAALTTKNTIAALFRSPILYSITYSSSSLLLNFLYIAVHIFASQEIVTISRAAHTEVLVSHRGRQLLSLKRDLY